MTDNVAQVFYRNEPTQESSYTTYEHPEDMSSALVIVNNSSRQICDEKEYLNESVTVENVSVSNLD